METHTRQNKKSKNERVRDRVQKKKEIKKTRSNILCIHKKYTRRVEALN